MVQHSFDDLASCSQLTLNALRSSGQWWPKSEDEYLQVLVRGEAFTF